MQINKSESMAFHRGKFSNRGKSFARGRVSFDLEDGTVGKTVFSNKTRGNIDYAGKSCGENQNSPSIFKHGGRGRGFRFKNFRNKHGKKQEEPIPPEMVFTKPWVTANILAENAKKEEYLDNWRDSNSNEDWIMYKNQKEEVRKLYDFARIEYARQHPSEVWIWTEVPGKIYNCDTCDKTFHDEDNYFLHENEHEICGRQGCTFTAHPKVVAKHIQMQHQTGLYKKILMSDQPKDVQKWIEDRKRAYPTRANIEKKKLINSEKIKRGEVIKEVNKRMSSTLPGSSSHERRVKKKKNRPRRTCKKYDEVNKFSRPTSLTVADAYEECKSDVPAFRGLDITTGDEQTVDQVTGKPQDDYSDGEWIEEERGMKVQKIPLSTSLNLLSTMYGSDSDQNDVKTHNKTVEDNDSGPEEVKTVVDRDVLLETSQEDDRKDRVGRKRKQVNRHNRTRLESVKCKTFRRPLTLLERLLSEEIKHERNVIMQCLHYVARNNFFDNNIS